MYSVPFGIRRVPTSKLLLLSKFKSKQISNLNLKSVSVLLSSLMMKSRNSKERAKKLANINKEQDAGRAPCAKAILAKAIR